MKELSPKQRRILEFIQGFIDEHAYPPSIRQIQEACDISSTSVVDYNLRILERLGHIRRDREVSRAIELLQPGGRRPRVIPVPLIGTLAPDQTIEVSPEMVGNRGQVPALRGRGRSPLSAGVPPWPRLLGEAASTAR